jgi:glycosyltransferase involved in cell wall biosynthesis
MSEPIRVLLLSHLYPRPDQPAYGTFVARRAEALSEHVDLKVISPVRCVPMTRGALKMESKIEPVLTRSIEVLWPHYISFPRHPLWSLNGDLMYWSVRETLRSLYECWPFQVLHAHTAYPDGYAAYRFLRAFRGSHPEIRSVLGVGGSDVYIQPGRSRAHRQKIVKALRDADVVLGVSRALCRKVRQMVPRARCVTVPNGVDAMRFDLTEEQRGELGRLRMDLDAKDNRVFLFVGSMLFSKGIRELLSAFREVQRARPETLLVLVGRTQEKRYVRGTAEEYGIADRVRIIGSVNPEEIPKWMHLADVFVLPSHTEGMPNVVLEAMAARKPVIAADVGGVSEVIQDGVSGVLVPPRDPESLKRAMLDLLSDEEKATRMGTAGRERIESSFTLRNTALGIARVYRKALERER